jgi:hypothetical protein
MDASTDPVAQLVCRLALTPVHYRGEIVAAAGTERFYLAPRVAQLGASHPLGRFAAVMCLYDRDVRSGDVPGPHDQRAAELYARCVLIPDERFERLADESDIALADVFRVPVEQIAAKRIDLGDDADRRGRAPGRGTYPRRTRTGR